MENVIKPCKKCLLSEFDEQKYIDELKSHIDWLPQSIRADSRLYDERLSVCRDCDYLSAGTCLACGCYVEMRAAVKKNKCPYKKW
jgi:hypothetical protein